MRSFHDQAGPSAAGRETPVCRHWQGGAVVGLTLLVVAEPAACASPLILGLADLTPAASRVHMFTFLPPGICLGGLGGFVWAGAVKCGRKSEKHAARAQFADEITV